ncbi:MAG: alpha/beta fold hydrolase [Elusimicrobia bacterium]|nr:alpha/beta fold hydrolase [Elusimicrobiota bacterium]
MKIRAVKFRVAHEWRVGGLLYAPGAAATPAVLMLHGFPGFQQNEDIAAELCRRGMTVFVPRFRGCWGSSGCFSVHGMLEDAAAALRLLSRYPQVDRGRVALLGYSAGAWAALKLAARVPVAAVAALAPIVPRRDSGGDADYLRRNARVVRTRGLAEVWRDYLAAAREEHPEIYIPKIAPAQLLLVQGLKDDLARPEQTARLWRLAGGSARLLQFREEGHEFQTNRSAVVAAVCGWLESKLASPAKAPRPPAAAAA